MKNKLLVLLCIIALLIVGFFLFSHNGQKAEPVQPPLAGADKTNIPAAKAPQPSISAQPMNANGNAAPTPPGQAIPTSGLVTPEEKDAKMRAVIETKNVPIDFYGCVIDQDSNSLSGVKISAWVRHWSTTSWESTRVEKETDTNGRFDIHGVTGDGFSIQNIGREGYEIEPNMQRNYGAIGGSSENPVIFKMWSTNSHEQLITGGKSFHIVPDGRIYSINLADDTISESGVGDLKVWIQFTNQVVLRQVYGWSCEIDVKNGGLLEETDHFSSMYSAPTEGYVPNFQLQQQIRGGQSGSIGEKRFYINLNNGQKYGRMTIDLIAPYNDQIPGMVRLSYAINPSGSRILR